MPDDASLKLFGRAAACFVPTLSTVHGCKERLAANPNACPPAVSATAIVAATTNAADLPGVRDIGALRPGCDADLIAVAGDLLVDVTALKTVDFVMKRGAIVKGAQGLPLSVRACSNNRLRARASCSTSPASPCALAGAPSLTRRPLHFRGGAASG